MPEEIMRQALEKKWGLHLGDTRRREWLRRQVKVGGRIISYP